MPPVPAAVMMWLNAKEVTEMSDRVPVGRPLKVAPSASQESSTTSRPYWSASTRIASQSGAFPIKLGTKMAFVRGPIISQDPVCVDVVGVGFDIHVGRRQTRSHERCHVGRKGDRGSDHLISR